MKQLILINNFVKPEPAFRLSDERLKRALILKDKYEKTRFISAEKITCDALSFYYGISEPVITGTAGKKPEVLDHNIFFSRSYTKDKLALAIDNSDIIGIDAEEIMEEDKHFMSYFFTEKEKDYVRNSADKDFAFTLIWTRKESYIKCIGEGLKFSFDTLNTTPSEAVLSGEKLFETNQLCNDCYINSYRIENIVISVCSRINEDFPLIKKGMRK